MEDDTKSLRAALFGLTGFEVHRLDDPAAARTCVEQLIADLRDCPNPELSRLGRTLHAWRGELCAHFDHPAVSNGPPRTST